MRPSVRIGRVAFSCTLLLCCFMLSGSRRITGQENPNAPGVVILVQPIPEGTILAITYPKQVEAAKVKEKIAKLAQETGGNVTGVQVSMAALPATDIGNKKKTIAAKQTVAEVTITGGQWMQENGFLLAPFVHAFADDTNIEVCYVQSPLPNYRGLTAYENEGVSVQLVQAGSPYRYRLHIKDMMKLQEPLPVVQPVSAPKPAAAHIERKTTLGISLLTILFIALGSAVLIFFLFSLLLRRRPTR